MRSLVLTILCLGSALIAADAAEAGAAATVVDDEDEDVAIVVGEDEDAPPLPAPSQEEELRVDPRTGARLYDGYRLIRTMPQTQEHLDVLRFVSNGVEDYWTPIPANISTVGQKRPHVDILVGPRHFSHVASYLECQGVPYEVAITDLQQAIQEENIPAKEADEQLVGRPGFCPDKSGFNWRQYHRLNVMNHLMDCLAREHPDKVELIPIGNSYEGRPLRVIKIGRNNGAAYPGASHRPAVWIDGGIHAREWISPATVLYLAHVFVEDYDSHRDILDNYDVYIMPVMNPDGYEYTWSKDRMWRKTRSKNSNSRCAGADPNRNWSYRWGGEGASDRACTEIYMGSRPFSERETRAVADFIMKNRKSIRLFLTFHSYGQYILYPWGYTDRGLPPNYRDLHSLAEVMNGAMEADYTIGSAAKVLYPAAGGSDDWAKGEAKIEYSYTVELPDTGRHGFLLPASRIEKTVTDTHAGVKAMLRELVHNRPRK